MEPVERQFSQTSLVCILITENEVAGTGRADASSDKSRDLQAAGVPLHRTLLMRFLGLLSHINQLSITAYVLTRPLVAVFEQD